MIIIAPQEMKRCECRWMGRLRVPAKCQPYDCRMLIHRHLYIVNKTRCQFTVKCINRHSKHILCRGENTKYECVRLLRITSHAVACDSETGMHVFLCGHPASPVLSPSIVYSRTWQCFHEQHLCYMWQVIYLTWISRTELNERRLQTERVQVIFLYFFVL